MILEKRVDHVAPGTFRFPIKRTTLSSRNKDIRLGLLLTSVYHSENIDHPVQRLSGSTDHDDFDPAVVLDDSENQATIGVFTSNLVTHLKVCDKLR